MKMSKAGTNLNIEMSEQELDQLNKSLAALDQQLALRGQKRCCDCNDGTKYTIEESNDALAILKCLSKCGPQFQMSNHACDEDRTLKAAGGESKAKNTACEIKYAVRQAGIDLTDDQIAKIMSGEAVSVKDAAAKAARSLCSGYKIRDFGNGCGLYLTWNGMISYCCEF